MNLPMRIVVIISGLAVTIVSLIIGRAMISETSSQFAEIISIEQKWLAGAAVLYVATFVSAWHFRSSFSLSASRMLIWAVIAYLALSHGIDILGNHRIDISTFLGARNSAMDAEILTAVRARVISMIAVVYMGIIGIGVGFESPTE